MSSVCEPGTCHDSNWASHSSLYPTWVCPRGRSHQPIQWRCTESIKWWLYISIGQVLPSASPLWSYWGFRLNSQQLHRIPGERDWKRCWRVTRSNWSFIADRSKSVRLWRRERVGAWSPDSVSPRTYVTTGARDSTEASKWSRVRHKHTAKHILGTSLPWEPWERQWTNRRRDFPQDRILFGKIELRWVFDCSRFLLTLVDTVSKKRTRQLWHKALLSSCCVRQQRWETQQVTVIGKTPMELPMGRRPSFHESRTADIHINQPGPPWWRDSKVGYEDSSWSPTTRRYSSRSCWTDEICSSQPSSGRVCFTGKKMRAKFSKDANLVNGWRWIVLLSKVPWRISVPVRPFFRQT